MDIPTPKSLQRQTQTNMDTISKKNRQNRDTASESHPVLSGVGLFQSEDLMQFTAEPSTPALDEASRDAETFGGTGDATFSTHLEGPMPFNNGYYQPTEATGLPTPYGHLAPEGNPLSHLAIPDPSPIFADTVLSENVRKRFLFAKNQRQRPIPASEESSGLSGPNRSITNMHKRGDFVNCGAGAKFKENKRLEDIHEKSRTPVEDSIEGRFQNLNLSYNTPMGFKGGYRAPIPSSASAIPPSFLGPRRPGGPGVAFKDAIPSLRDGQAPGFHLPMDQDRGEGSKFVMEQLMPLHSFSHERLVPCLQLTTPARSPQEHLPATEPLRPSIDYTEGRCKPGVPGISREPHLVERASDLTTSHPFNPRAEEFIARQTPNPRPRPPYWRTRCHWTMKPLGEAAGSCHYGRGCLYGHDGDVYEDNIGVYYTFENGRARSNFLSPALPGQPLGAQGPCSPWVVREANPQAFHAGPSNKVLGNDRVSHPLHAPGDAPTFQPDFPWLPAPQHAGLGRGQLPSSTEASITDEEPVFRREPLIRVADCISYYNNSGFQSQAIGNIGTGMEEQSTLNDEGAPGNV